MANGGTIPACRTARVLLFGMERHGMAWHAGKTPTTATTTGFIPINRNTIIRYSKAEYYSVWKQSRLFYGHLLWVFVLV